MGPIAIRQRLLRLRRHMAGVVAVVTLASAVAAHHAGASMATPGAGMTHDASPSTHHGGGHDDEGTAVTVACVAVLVAIGAGVLVAAFGLFRLRWEPPARATARFVPRRRPAAQARAGPPGPQLLCVWRI